MQVSVPETLVCLSQVHMKDIALILHFSVVAHESFDAQLLCLLCTPCVKFCVNFFFV
jgi:hypothetical protein